MQCSGFHWLKTKHICGFLHDLYEERKPVVEIGFEMFSVNKLCNHTNTHNFQIEFMQCSA